MVGFKITNLLTNAITFLYAFLFCGLVGGFSFLELFAGSWGSDNEFITESFILLLSSGFVVVHGFFFFILGIIAFAAWRNKPKSYLICNLICSIIGIVGMGLMCLLYSVYYTGSIDQTVLEEFPLRSEVLFLGYIALCGLGLVLTLLSHFTRPQTVTDNG